MRVAQFSEFGGTSGTSPRGGGRAEPRARRCPHQSDGGRPQLLRHAHAAQPVPSDSPPLPFSPGAEIAGSIEAVGADVADLKLGQRVVAFIGGNGCREKVVTKARNVVPIPDGVSDEVAAGIPITYGTALHGLKDRGANSSRVRRVAVLGAAGGAGVAASRDRQAHGRAGHRRRLVGRQARLCPRAWRRGRHQLRDGRSQDAPQAAHRAERRRRALRRGRRRLCRAELAGDGLGGTLSRARLRLGHDSENSAQSGHAQGLRHHRACSGRRSSSAIRKSTAPT